MLKVSWRIGLNRMESGAEENGEVGKYAPFKGTTPRYIIYALSLSQAS